MEVQKYDKNYITLQQQTLRDVLVLTSKLQDFYNKINPNGALKEKITTHLMQDFLFNIVYPIQNKINICIDEDFLDERKK
jgi:hypothetical protein